MSSSQPNARVNYLLLVKKLGKATPAELEELQRSYLLIGPDDGGKLAVPAPCNPSEWRARYTNAPKHD